MTLKFWNIMYRFYVKIVIMSLDLELFLLHDGSLMTGVQHGFSQPRSQR